MDAASGEVLWARRPIDDGLGLPAPYGMIHHVCPFGDDRLLVQASGRRWLLAASTGKTLAEARDALAAWPRPPVLLPDGGALVVAAVDRVERLGAKAVAPLWTFTPPGKTTRSGGPPLALGDGKRVAVVVPENLGLRLVGLDAQKGKPLWSRLVEGDPDRLGADAWTLGERLYGVEGDTLRAWSMDTGKFAWEQPLPGGRSSRLSLSGQTLLAWPARVPALALRFQRGSEALQLNVGPWPQGEGVLPLWCLDAGDGVPVGRLNLPSERPAGRVIRRHASGGLFPTFEAGFAGADGPSLRQDGRRLTFGLGRQVRVWDNGPAAAAKK
jgi:outer membrane protein assembly factor BamB